MKLYKLFAIGLAAVTMTACSDDDKVNTASDVTVAMQQDKMSVSEDYSAGTYYNVPIIVEGEANGPIKVEVQVSAFGDSPATEGVDYLVTSMNIVIPEGEKEGYVEFYPVGDYEINDDRQFAVTIVKAQGAAIADQATTIVTLVDNDVYLVPAYENIQGDWTLSTDDPDDECIITITGAEPGEEGYLKTLTVSGWGGYSWFEIEAPFSFDAVKMAAQIRFVYGQYCATNVDAGSLGEVDVMFAGVADGYLVNSGSVLGDVSSDYTSISVPSSASFVGAMFASDSGSFTGYVNFWYENIKIKR